METEQALYPGDDRPRGVLSQADREFLKGKKEFASEQSRRDARYRIRQRIRHAVLDFSLILHHLEKRDRRQIFSSYDDKLSEEGQRNPSKEDVREVVENTMFASGVSDTIAFLYLGLGGVNQSFEPILESAVKTAEEERGYIIRDMAVNIDVSRGLPNTDHLQQKLAQGAGLTEDELRALIRSGELEFTEDTLDEIFDQMSMLLSNDLEEGDITLHFDTEES